MTTVIVLTAIKVAGRRTEFSVNFRI